MVTIQRLEEEKAFISNELNKPSGLLHLSFVEDGYFTLLFEKKEPKHLTCGDFHETFLLLKDLPIGWTIQMTVSDVDFDFFVGEMTKVKGITATTVIRFKYVLFGAFFQGKRTMQYFTDQLNCVHSQCSNCTFGISVIRHVNVDCAGMLKALTSRNKLTVLSFPGITEELFDQYPDLHALRMLGLCQVRFTRENIAILRRTLPRCIHLHLARFRAIDRGNVSQREMESEVEKFIERCTSNETRAIIAMTSPLFIKRLQTKKTQQMTVDLLRRLRKFL